jgi:maltose O-acetyltransferase
MARNVRSEKEEMLAGRLYDASDPELVAERLRARDLLFAFNGSLPADKEKRRALLGDLFAQFGESSLIEPIFHCDYGYNISFGKGSYANVGCVFLDVMPIRIGNEVLFGPAVQLYAATHPLAPEERATGLELGAPITIEDRVWVGGGTVVCPGVTIGKGSVIGAGSVVTRDIPERVVAVGNPCRVVRHIP